MDVGARVPELQRRPSGIAFDIPHIQRACGEVERTKLEITAVSGERIQNLVRDIYATTPAEVALKAAAMVK